MTACDICKKVRTDEPDYSPMQLLFPNAARVGWYSGDDGEICPDDMKKLFDRANR